MRGLEEGKGKLLRRENNNHMLIMFSLQMHRKYTNQLRARKPKGTALPGCCWGVIIFGVWDFFFFFFQRRSGPSPVRGRKDLIPTAALYALFTTSPLAFTPGTSDFL